MKRIILLVATASLISAGLLFLGITVMGQFSLAQASPMEALVAGPGSQVDPTQEQTASVTATVEVTPIAASLPAGEVTIAELFNSPAQYLNQVFTLRGIATVLTDEKLLLNDGTGQILVELEDGLGRQAELDGLSISVTGKFDDASGGYKLEAFSLTTSSGMIFTRSDDDGSDDEYDDRSDDRYDDSNSDDDSYSDDRYDDRYDDSDDDRYDDSSSDDYDDDSDDDRFDDSSLDDDHDDSDDDRHDDDDSDDDRSGHGSDDSDDD